MKIKAYIIDYFTDENLPSTITPKQLLDVTIDTTRNAFIIHVENNPPIIMNTLPAAIRCINYMQQTHPATWERLNSVTNVADDNLNVMIDAVVTTIVSLELNSMPASQTDLQDPIHHIESKIQTLADRLLKEGLVTEPINADDKTRMLNTASNFVDWSMGQVILEKFVNADKPTILMGDKIGMAVELPVPEIAYLLVIGHYIKTHNLPQQYCLYAYQIANQFEAHTKMLKLAKRMVFAAENADMTIPSGLDESDKQKDTDDTDDTDQVATQYLIMQLGCKKMNNAMFHVSNSIAPIMQNLSKELSSVWDKLLP